MNVKQDDNIKEEKDKSGPSLKDIAIATSSLGAIGSSKDMLLGKKRMYHGTSMDNWNKIKDQGLLSNRGGLSGASARLNSQEYIDASKNAVHLTRFKPVANMYARYNDVAGDAMTNMDMITKPKNGKVLKVNMDYDKFKKMKIDNVGSDDISDIPKIFRPAAKNMAAKGNINVTPAEIAGSSATLKDRVTHTAKALPGYIKNNPLRFGAGAALAGAGVYGLSKLNKKKEEEKTASEIVCEVFGEIRK